MFKSHNDVTQPIYIFWQYGVNSKRTGTLLLVYIVVLPGTDPGGGQVVLVGVYSPLACYIDRGGYSVLVIQEDYKGF